MVYTLGYFDFTSQILIIFVFTFAVVFGVLNLTRVFSRGVSVLVSFALAFFAISYPPFVNLLWTYIPGMIWIFIILFFIGFIFKMIGFEPKKHEIENLPSVAITLLLLLSVGGLVMKFLPGEIPLIGRQENLLFLLGLLFILLMIFLIFRYHHLSEAYEEMKQKAAAKQ